MSSKLRSFAILLSLASPTLYAQLAHAQKADPDAGLIANPVFENNCAKCHGKNAQGRHFGGPALISEKIAAVAADDLRNIVTNGRGQMPKFAGKLTPQEIDTLVRQIKGANKKYQTR